MARKESIPGQRYACDRPGCDKHYSRPDHLLRHKLNHDRDKVLSCDQCDRTFVRQDLLTRHLERHALRGKTLGRWSGRQHMEQSTSSNTIHDGNDEVSDEERNPHGQYQHFRQPVRQEGMEPGSLTNFEKYEAHPFAYAPQINSPQYGYRVESINQSQGIGPPLPYDVLENHHPQTQTQYTFGRPSTSRNGRVSWDPSSSTVNPPGQPTQDSHFITADSLAARPISSPSTQWNNPPAYFPATSTASTSINAVIPLVHDNHVPFGSPSGALPPALPEGTTLLDSSVPGSSHFPFSAPNASDYIADYDWLFDGTNPLMSGQSDEMATTVSETSTARDTHQADDSSEVAHFTAIKDEFGDDNLSEINDYGRLERNGGGEADALHDLAFFAILQRDIPDEPAFDVDSLTHSRLVHFLSSVQELASSPLFTPAALRCYLHLYFVRVNAIYPLIHRPTFAAKSADPMLLSAMVVCGAHFADEAAHFLAERIGRKLWGAFITFEDFRPARATLALLQAMLITETFGKMMGTRPQHETAHLFHNFIVTLARRNAVFIQSKVKLPENMQKRWRVWSREEEKKRIALYSFILDAQHATIFRHIPALSAFQIHLQLPCDDDEWEAQSAADWSQIRRDKRCNPPNFIAALKANMISDLSFPVGRAEGFKHFVLLHGLMSVAYDLQWKQQALLAAPETSESISNWKERLMMSYDICKQRLDTKANPTAMDKASHSLVEWAQIVLHVDPVDVQIYAGLPTVMGRFIDHHTFSVARKSCRDWARTTDARIALWHAAKFLESSLLTEVYGSDSVDRPSVTGVDTLLHHQWVQYLSSLIIWAYEQAIAPLKSQVGSRPRSQDGESNHSSVEQTMIANDDLQPPADKELMQPLAKRMPVEQQPMDKATREASLYLSYITNISPDDDEAFEPPFQYSSSVLELVEKECRGSRWELGREASGVLRKLLRERKAQMANRQQSPSAIVSA